MKKEKRRWFRFSAILSDCFGYRGICVRFFRTGSYAEVETVVKEMSVDASGSAYRAYYRGGLVEEGKVVIGARNGRIFFDFRKEADPSIAPTIYFSYSPPPLDEFIEERRKLLRGL